MISQIVILIGHYYNLHERRKVLSLIKYWWITFYQETLSKMKRLKDKVNRNQNRKEEFLDKKSLANKVTSNFIFFRD